MAIPGVPQTAPLASSRQQHLPQSSLDSPESRVLSPHQANPYNRPATSHAVRDGPVVRGRAPPSAGQNIITSSSRTPSAHRFAQENEFDTFNSPSSDAGLQRRASNRHHRQTSVINGLQHSRNPSFNSPLTSSPLSPESLHNATLNLASARRTAMDSDPTTSPARASVPAAHLQTASIDSTLNLDPRLPDAAAAARRRNDTSRTRRPQAHNASSSFSYSEGRTPGEYAMHHLFHAFVLRADQKIQQCIAHLDSIPDPVEHFCVRGADPSFDQLLSALGHVTRQHPKPLVDSLMFWRQAKADSASAARKQFTQHRTPTSAGALPIALPRRHTEPLHSPADSDQPFMPTPTTSLADDHDHVFLDRQATISIFLLCRGLIEVFEQSSLESITPELNRRLLDIVYMQLRGSDPSQVSGSSVRLANWRIYGTLLGQMSVIDFTAVTKRYYDSLREWQHEITTSTGTASARDREGRVELLLLSMQHLRVNVRTPSRFDALCWFLQCLAQLFIDSHGPRIKQGYCLVFESLLTQMANDITHVHHSTKLTNFLENISPRVNQMLTKLRHWTNALPLSVVLLNVSPFDAFNSQWLPMTTSLSTKLRDRSTRTPAMRAICQLLWTYLRRTSDATPTQARRVEEVIRLVFPAGKKPHITIEPSAAEAVLAFIRLVGLGFTDLCFKNIIMPLITSDASGTQKEMKIDQIDPEKVTIGIRAFLILMADKESQDLSWCTYPTFTVQPPVSDGPPNSPVPPRSLAMDRVVVPSRDELTISTSPVDTSKLDEATNASYIQFCESLGKITILCDQAFGSSAVLNEKFSVMTPKTPLTDAFLLNRKDDSSTADVRQSFYDLLHVAIQALPRCFTDHIPLNTLINLLCTGSAHVQGHIASAAAKSLKAIAQQGYAQSVATAFPRFIFSYDSQYSTMSDEGRLGPAHIETTLTLYVELLQIWKDQIQQKASQNASERREKGDNASTRALQMEMTTVLSVVDEVESYGLFFLCSQSRRVRNFAIKVLNIVVQFDQILGKDDQGRIVRVLESHSSEILEFNGDTLTLAERSRLQKDKRRSGNQNILFELSGSDITYDSALWFKAFPSLIKHVFELCPHPVALSRDIICERLAMMQTDVERLAAHLNDAREFKLFGRSSATPIEAFCDQWKLYLIMACVTLSSPGAQSQSQLANASHTHKASRNLVKVQEKLSSARALFSAVIPMLGAGADSLRSAVVVGLGSINRKLYRTLLESLQYAVITIDEVNARGGVSHQRTPSSPSRSQMTERMRTEVTHVYKLTATFLKHDEVLADEWVLDNVVKYTKELRLFLNDTNVQADSKFVKLRTHYCGLIEELFNNIRRCPDPNRWLSFESRKSAFALMEDWCGFSGDNPLAIRADVDFEDKRLIAAVEKEKINLRLAALSAMASLCAGPIQVLTENNTVLQFNVGRMLSWIDSVFTSPNNRMHQIGQRALKHLILFNSDDSVFIEHAVQSCYGVKGSGAVDSCFSVLSDIVVNHPTVKIDLIKVLGAILFTLGNENRSIRMRSAQLLKTLDARQQRSSGLQDFDISVSDKTRAVYKAAQFEYSRRLAQTHPDLAFLVFSEFTLQFLRVPVDIQRSMIAAVLPWLQTLELQVTSDSGVPTALTNMLMVNMIEITIRASNILHNEVQALWQALATGPYGGNVQLILDFIIELCLERREQNFVEFAKQIIVHLSTTPAGSRVLQFFLMQIVPKNMISEKKHVNRSSFEYPQVSYVANLDNVLKMGHKQGPLSLGQISLILLVDLLVPPLSLEESDVLKLVHTVTILWDHYTTAVQESAKEMLVHLIHVCIATKIENSPVDSPLTLIEQTVEAIRNNEGIAVWSYEDHTGKNDYEGSGDRVPTGMHFLTDGLLSIFSLTFENFSDLWAKQALHWASVCPVRHLACRSFQVLRCVSSSLDMSMLADMLARLSNTISDEQSDYQTFSLEILTSLKMIIAAQDAKDLKKYPQLLWTTVACMNTIHEREYFESLGMLAQVLETFDLGDRTLSDSFLRAKPADWQGDFTGLDVLVYRGFSSADCWERALGVLQQLTQIPNNALVGQSDRLLFTVLAHLPLMLHGYDEDLLDDNHAYIPILATAARREGLEPLAAVVETYTAAPRLTSEQFLSQVIGSLKPCITGAIEAECLIFAIGLLTNQVPWFRLKTMQVLCHLIPLIDLQKPAIASHGADLISPLLRILQTDQCEEALKVMDLLMMMPVTPMDKHHLRMSMASGPARAIRKEYERTQSLYGIPEASGWSVPVPALHSVQTRANVHAVFYTCTDANNTNDLPSQTPEVEFHVDDGYEDSYFPPQDRADHTQSYESFTEANLGDIVSTLDSLDDFFDDVESPVSPTLETRQSGLGRFSFVDEDDTDVYDQQTAPILSRSFNRTSSSLSFQNGLNDTRPSTSHLHRPQISFSSNGGSLQSSFTSIEEDEGPGPEMPNSGRRGPTLAQVSTNMSTRPGLHARSITSPANQYAASQAGNSFSPSIPGQASYESAATLQSFEDVLSDSDSSPFPSLTPSTSQATSRSMNSTPVSANANDGSSSVMKRGLRRLTGGKSESAKEKARLRAPSISQPQLNPSGAPASSPRMPRIPSGYLRDTSTPVPGAASTTIPSPNPANPTI